MTHPSREILESFRLRTLPRHELLEVDLHIAICEACARTLAEGMTPTAALHRAFEAVQGQHLTYEQIEGYVDQEVGDDERARVVAHIALCEACAREIENLEEFRGGTRGTWRWWAVAAVAAAVLLAVILTMLSRRTSGTPRAPSELTASGTPTATSVETPPSRPPVEDPLQSLSPSLRKVAEALQSGALPSATLLSSLQPPPEQQRTNDTPPAKDIRVVSPIGQVIETDRPSFRWTRATAGADVTVQIYDQNYSLVAESPRLSGSSWPLPTSLRRGATYRWQLRVESDRNPIVPSPPDPPALFHVLSRRSLDELTAARKTGSSLEVGLICLREGLIAEGKQALTRYAAEHPDSPTAAQIALHAREATAGFL